MRALSEKRGRRDFRKAEKWLKVMNNSVIPTYSYSQGLEKNENSYIHFIL